MVPIKNAKIIKSFGWVYEKGRRRFHDGIDIVSESGDTRVSAILHGRVLTCSECYMHDLHWGNREYIGAHQYCLMKCDINGDEYYFKYLNLKNLSGSNSYEASLTT